MLFTPLLPNAGPTGGDGDACPAPTMSLTITSLASAFLDIVADVMGVLIIVADDGVSRDAE